MAQLHVLPFHQSDVYLFNMDDTFQEIADDPCNTILNYALNVVKQFAYDRLDMPNNL